MIKQFFYILLLMSFLNSCKLKKFKTNINEEEQIESAPPEEYFKIREGFVLATVVNDYEKKGCPFLLKIEDNFYQVVGMDSSLNVNKLKIWIKFSPSKIVLKECKIGIPIVLTEVYVSDNQYFDSIKK
jgi:hypothetical protein